MPTVAYDLKYLREALDSLESYLLSEEVFWNFPVSPPPGEPVFPALTLGGILLAQKRLESRRLAQTEYASFRSISLQLDAIRTRWRTAWEKKAAVEYNARLTQWRNFLEDYRRSPPEHADRYPYEVRLRVMLHLLDQANPFVPNELRQLLSSLDALLSASMVSQPFIWEDEYQKGFPEEQFPYLHGLLVNDEI